MGVDVMVAGHTHQLSVRQGNEGGLYINPGSVRRNCKRSMTRRQNPCIAPRRVLILYSRLALDRFLSRMRRNCQATGCSTVSDPEEPDASFVLIDVQGNKIVTYSYVLERRGEAEVSASPSTAFSLPKLVSRRMRLRYPKHLSIRSLLMCSLGFSCVSHAFRVCCGSGGRSR